MLLTDEERFVIILSAIRDYEKGTNDIGIIIVEKIANQIMNSINIDFDTQQILDEIIETFNYYNDFVTEKNIDMQKIPDSMIDLVEHYINEIVKNIDKEDD